MPKFEQTIDTGNTDNETVLAWSYLAIQQLQWEIQFAGDNALQALTPRNWKTYGQEILCTVDNGALTIKSDMTHGEMLDAGGRNKKNTAQFITAFESVKATASAEQIEATSIRINELRKQTIQTLEQNEKDAIEIDKAMNLSGSNLYVTYTIIGINLLVFILMAINGAGIVDANGFVHIAWGSNFPQLTLSGDWWRLVTNVFIHFGVIHLLMNMYCLYTVGIYLEPMLGKIRYTAAYLCTGVLASIVSIWWHKEAVNSAGASGAIFGLYGLFLALLTSNLIPKKVRDSLLQNIGIFIIYNLAYGMKSGVDNAAHVGGLISGFIIGYGYIFGIKKEKRQEQKIQWIAPAVVILTLVIGFAYLQQNKITGKERNKILSEVKEATYQDNEKFNDRLKDFDKLHEEAMLATIDTSKNYTLLAKKIDEIAMPKFLQAEQLISATKSYDISPASHAKAAKLLQYINLKKDELAIMKKICETNNEEALMPQLEEIREKAGTEWEALTKQE